MSLAISAPPRPTYTDVPQVLAQLLDLPAPFVRPSTPFAWIYQALAGAEAGYTLASWGIAAQVSGVPTASGPWLTVWGEILGLARLSGESDGAYRARVLDTLSAPVGTVVAIQTWSRFILGTPYVYVTENSGGLGYSISIPAGLSPVVTGNWITSLARIRPAGVPFTVQAQAGPLMLGTYSYLGASGFAGAYLGNGAQATTLGIGASTNNAQVLIPETLMTDPTLNGQVSLGLG